MKKLFINQKSNRKVQPMKTKLKLKLIALCSLLSGICLSAFAQGTAFTYQGQLQNNGNPASGTYNLTFNLYTNSTGGTAVAGPVTNSAVVVSNGLFTVAMDFGSGVWNGQTNWLEIGVETNGSNSFTTLAPRQQLTPTPYAIFANTASNLSGTLPTSQLIGMLNNSQLANSSITVSAGTGLSGGGTVALGGSTTLNNAGVTSLTGGGGVTVSAANGAVTLGSTATSADTANAIVSRDASGNFSAGSVTLDGELNLPAASAVINSGGSSLLLSEGNQNLFLGLQAGNPTVSGVDNTGIGYRALLSDTSGYENTAIGLGALESNLNGYQNTADGLDALGENGNGSENTAMGFWALAENTAGSYNTADGYYALVDNTTGSNNVAVGFGALVDNYTGSYNTAVGSGALQASGSSQNTAIGGDALYADSSGADNTAVGYYAMIVNTTGFANTADGYYALIQNNGGNNIALGYYSGYNITTGSSNIDIGNQGIAGDNNIIRIGTGQTATYLAGNVYATSFNPTSDRNAKENFSPVDYQAVLAKVTLLPVTQWNFKKESKSVQHIGPMAQDFQAAFHLSADDKHISLVDEGGVALAAIQGLNQKLEADTKAKDAEIESLKQSVAELKQIVQNLVAQK
jgi:hypothetical protein